MAGGFVLGALLGLGVGARLAIPGPAAPGPSPSAGIVDVLPDSVSQRLRDAYYGSGAAIRVCIAGDSIVCSRATIGQTARIYADIALLPDAAELRSLTPVAMPPGRIIVVGDFGPVDGAAIASLQSSRVTRGQRLTVANPERRGIDYIDLGELGPGTYLVSIGVPSWLVPTALVEVIVQ